MSYYLGVDIGKRNHMAALTNKQGVLLSKPFPFTATAAGWQQLVSYLTKHTLSSEFGEWSRVQVGFEATGHYWLTLYEQCSKLGMPVVVLNPLEVKAFRNEGIRGNKTDAIDAVKIAKLLRFGEYHEAHVPSEAIVALRQLTRLRGDLVVMVGQLKQQCVSILDQVFPEYEQLFYDTFGTTSKALLSTAATPEAVGALPTQELTSLLHKASRGRLGEEHALAIKQAASQSIGRTIGLDAFALSLEILLKQIEHLQTQVDQLEQEIAQRMTTLDTTLTTIPGIGVTLGATILAEVGEVNRFVGKDGAEKLVALAGIDPKLKESGQYQGKTKMSKRGSSYLRSALRQAAFVAVMVVKDPMFIKIYEKQINKGKHMEVALSHVERKMAHVIYSLLQSNKPYRPVV